ncbi:MFS transporter [Kribbella sp. NBC_01505]|uniref:MFS transporter n=1 Tax=Kribbella sp. NBC_01505 TaxID=2903580 RepID=UPI00386572D6
MLCGYLAFGAALQALPTYVPTRYGGGALASGTAVGIAFLATACTRPFAGWLADGGWSRPVVLAGAALTAIGAVGQLAAPNLPTLLVARLIMGAGEAALFSAALPWVLAGTRVAQRGRLAGWFGLSMWGGLAGGPLIAALTGDLVWWTMAGLAGTSMILVLTTRPSSGHVEPLVPIRELAPSGIPLPGAIIGLAAYCYGTIAALLVLHLRAEELRVDGYALTVFAGTFLIVRFAGSPLVDRYGGRVVAAATVGIEMVALTGIAAARSATGALAFTALAGLGLALIYPACISMTLDRVRGMRPGVSMGVMTSFWDLGVMAAGPVGGLIAEQLGFPTAFVVAAGAAAASLLLCLAFLRPRRAVSPR